MSSTDRKAIDKMIERGESVRQGVVPELDPVAGFHAQVWSDCRSSTPGEHPISMETLALYLGTDAIHDELPIIQHMDGVYFAFHTDVRQKERKRAEEKAEAARRRARR